MEKIPANTNSYEWFADIRSIHILQYTHYAHYL